MGVVWGGWEGVSCVTLGGGGGGMVGESVNE